jgi:hypothetical protein
MMNGFSQLQMKLPAVIFTNLLYLTDIKSGQVQPA